MVAFVFMLVIFLSLLVCIQSLFPLFSKTPELVVSETVIEGVRGVPAHLQSKYIGESFVCDDSTHTYSINELNDGYCDCLDGSDEPGTSACAGNTFYCVNKAYRLIQITSSKVDDGVCDCCDGSDEGTLIKCGNTCIAVAATEKVMIQKMASTYNIGKLIRDKDIKKIQQSKEDLILNIEPLRISVKNQEKTVENFLKVKREAEDSHSLQTKSMDMNFSNKIENILNLNTMKNSNVAQLLSSIFHILDMNDEDVKVALKDCDIQPFDLTVPLNDYHNNNENEDNNDDDNDYNENEENSHENDHDRHEKSEVPSQELKIPVNCDIFDHTQDTRLYLLCTYISLANSNDDNSSALQEADVNNASTISMENIKKLITQLLKSRSIYTEIQLLYGYYQIKGSYSGAIDFVRSHRETSQNNDIEFAHICPADWSNSKHKDILCTISEKLQGIYNEYNNNYPVMNKEYENNYNNENDILNNLNKELNILNDKFNDFNENYEFLEYLALKNKCFDGKEDKLTQKDTENPDNAQLTLGTFKNMEKNNDTGGVIMHFTEGTHCWMFGPRTADVFITCGTEHKMISSNEPTTCYYTFEVESPSGCTKEFADINGIA